jgi:hypothetical protein
MKTPFKIATLIRVLLWGGFSSVISTLAFNSTLVESVLGFLMGAVCTNPMVLGEVLLEDERIRNIIDVVIFYYELYMETWSDDAYSGFIKAMNRFLEEISHMVQYVPGLACKVSRAIIMSLWDARIEPSRLRKILQDLYNTLKNPNDSEELKKSLYELVSLIGDNNVVRDFLEENMQVERLISTATLILVIATNP